MGQTEKSAERNKNDLKHTTNYLLDFRLVQSLLDLPSYFSSSTQQIISQLEEAMSKVVRHPLEQYLVHTIDQRFSRRVRVNAEAITSGKASFEFLEVDESRFEHREWV
jgi:hypothetical protein